MSVVEALPSGSTVAGLVREASEALAQAWLERLAAAARARPGETPADGEGRRTAMELFHHFAAVFAADDYDDTSRTEYGALVARLRELARQRAMRGQGVAGCMDFPVLFKEVVVGPAMEDRLAAHPQAAAAELARFGRVTDRLVAQTVHAFVSSRDDLISRQSRALLELSTPVVVLWDSVLLLPLVGVIDTARAQQMVERLLEAIVQAEARVAILDITGVPVIDTRVARHLLVTIDAVRMLGAETILTGIRPDAAMTLTSLGIDLSRVRTKGSLKSGVAEALRLVGRTVRPSRAGDV